MVAEQERRRTIGIPGGLLHAAFGSGDVECIGLFVALDAAANLPTECFTVAISGRLRHLLIRAGELPERCEIDGPGCRIVAAILDELGDLGAGLPILRPRWFTYAVVEVRGASWRGVGLVSKHRRCPGRNTARGLDTVLSDEVTGQPRAKAVRVKTGTLVGAAVIASAGKGEGQGGDRRADGPRPSGHGRHPAVPGRVQRGEDRPITGHSLKDVRPILDAHDFHRDTGLADSGIAKLESAMGAAAAGPVNDDASSAAGVARKPRRFNGHTGAREGREKTAETGVEEAL